MSGGNSWWALLGNLFSLKTLLLVQIVLNEMSHSHTYGDSFIKMSSLLFENIFSKSNISTSFFLFLLLKLSKLKVR